MIRQPTPASTLYRWHREAVAGKAPAIHDSLPECGWFKVRMIKGGPYVPARIWVDREIDPETGELAADERLLCEIDGERRDPATQWVWLAKNPITRAEYDALRELRATLPTMAATHAAFDLTRNIIRP